ncbi:hypothetical protein QYM36_007842, partial [Artemia franciscana]
NEKLGLSETDIWAKRISNHSEWIEEEHENEIGQMELKASISTNKGQMSGTLELSKLSPENLDHNFRQQKIESAIAKIKRRVQKTDVLNEYLCVASVVTNHHVPTAEKDYVVKVEEHVISINNEKFNSTGITIHPKY